MMLPMRAIAIAVIAALAVSACSSAPKRRSPGRSAGSYATQHPDINKPPVEFSRPRAEPLIEPDRDPFAL